MKWTDFTTTPDDPLSRERDVTSFVDTETIQRIEDLELRARLVVEGTRQGLHRSRMAGFSAEFSEYRAYSPGDDLRYVDWRVAARTDRAYIKRFDDETNRRAYLILDRSRSMDYRSGNYSKLDYARTLSASLAFFLLSHRDAVGLVSFADTIDEILPARFRLGQLRRILSRLALPATGTKTSLPAALEGIAQSVRKRSLLVIVSDFLVEIDALQTPLAYLRSFGHEVIAMRVVDPTELELPAEERPLWEDLELGTQFAVDVMQARPEYQRRWQAHRNQWRAACELLGVESMETTTDTPLSDVLFDWLGRYARMSAQRVARGRAPGGPSA